jgi:copper chaperone CopZ
MIEMSTFKVKDMNCGHCEMTIKNEFSKLNTDVKIEINLQEKMIKIENLADEKVISLLKDIGFTSEKVK